MISTIVFILLLGAGGGLFFINAKKIRRNILLGKDINRTDNFAERVKTMTLVALGQKKMFTRPIPAILHLFLYAAFHLRGRRHQSIDTSEPHRRRHQFHADHPQFPQTRHRPQSPTM